MSTVSTVLPPVSSVPVAAFEKSSMTISQKLYNVVVEGLDCGSFVADIADSMKLSSFWSGYLSGGEASPESVRVTEAGSLIKNLMEAADFPKRAVQAVTDLGALATGKMQDAISNTAEFVASFFMAGQSLFEGAELGEKVGLLGKDVVALLNPFDSAGTAAFGLKSSAENVSDIRANWSQDSGQVTFSMMKLVRSVCFVAVGTLGLLSTFFKAAFAPWIIPVLLTGAVASSVSSRFFEGLVLPKSV